MYFDKVGLFQDVRVNTELDCIVRLSWRTNANPIHRHSQDRLDRNQIHCIMETYFNVKQMLNCRPISINKRCTGVLVPWSKGSVISLANFSDKTSCRNKIVLRRTQLETGCTETINKSAVVMLCSRTSFESMPFGTWNLEGLQLYATRRRHNQDYVFTNRKEEPTGKCFFLPF